MTETLKIELDDALAQRFRKRAMEKYGYEKGAVKKALEELVVDFAQKSKKPVDWSKIEGALGDEYGEMTSVELQHALWRIKYSRYSFRKNGNGYRCAPVLHRAQNWS